SCRNVKDDDVGFGKSFRVGRQPGAGNVVFDLKNTHGPGRVVHENERLQFSFFHRASAFGHTRVRNCSETYPRYTPISMKFAGRKRKLVTRSIILPDSGPKRRM